MMMSQTSDKGKEERCRAEPPHVERNLSSLKTECLLSLGLRGFSMQMSCSKSSFTFNKSKPVLLGHVEKDVALYFPYHAKAKENRT